VKFQPKKKPTRKREGELKLLDRKLKLGTFAWGGNKGHLRGEKTKIRKRGSFKRGNENSKSGIGG